MMKVSVSISGFEGIANSFKYIKRGMADGLDAIVGVGALPIETEAKRLAPIVTGALRQSIRTESVRVSATSALAKIGPHVPYGARIEFGFVGPDSLGRVYHQAPEPYMRPAYETKKQEAHDAMRDSAKEIIYQALEDAAPTRRF